MNKEKEPKDMAEAVRRILTLQPSCTVHVWTKEVRAEIEGKLTPAERKRCTWKVYK